MKFGFGIFLLFQNIKRVDLRSYVGKELGGDVSVFASEVLGN